MVARRSRYFSDYFYNFLHVLNKLQKKKQKTITVENIKINPLVLSEVFIIFRSVVNISNVNFEILYKKGEISRTYSSLKNIIKATAIPNLTSVNNFLAEFLRFKEWAQNRNIHLKHK